MFGITPEGALHKKLRHFGQKVRDFFTKIHKKIGISGWIALGLVIILVATIIHYEGRDRRVWKSSHRPMYIHKQSDWMRDIDRDFENMHRQMDMMRARHERMMREMWDRPLDIKSASTSSFVSNGEYQYSINTKDGKLDGFFTGSEQDIKEILPQMQKVGVSVEHTGNRLFFTGEARFAQDLIDILKQ